MKLAIEVVQARTQFEVWVEGFLFYKVSKRNLLAQRLARNQAVKARELLNYVGRSEGFTAHIKRTLE